MIIVLMGYMGSGKSTIGVKLAETINYKFIDLDDFIAFKENATVSQLFKTRGEVYFRTKEAHYLNEVLNTQDNVVLALGGGTPCYGNTLNNIKTHNNVKLIYLKIALPNLCKRLFLDRKKRPLISHLESEDALLEFIGKHLFERIPFYNQADITIDTNLKSQERILEEIVIHLI